MMKLLPVVLVLFTACQTQSPSVDTTSQAITDCFGVDNFPGAQNISTPYWQGQALPTPSTNQIWVSYTDPAAPSDVVFVLADVGAGKLQYGVRVNQASYGQLVQQLVDKPYVPGGRLPPPPPPPDGTNFDARFSLELGLRGLSAASAAFEAASKWP